MAALRAAGAMAARRWSSSAAALAAATAGLHPRVIAALNELRIATPSAVQTAAWRALAASGGGNIAIAGATGTGKTLAYMAPLFSQLRAEEDAALPPPPPAPAPAPAIPSPSPPAPSPSTLLALSDTPPVHDVEGTAAHAVLTASPAAGPFVHRRARPRMVVLTPTRELALQTLAVAKSLAHVVKLRCVGVVGGTRQGDTRDAVDGAVDTVEEGESGGGATGRQVEVDGACGAAARDAVHDH